MAHLLLEIIFSKILDSSSAEVKSNLHLYSVFDINIDMHKNQFEDILQQNDIHQILNLKENPESVEQQEIIEILKMRMEKVQEEIIKGWINIFDPRKTKEEINNLQKERIKKEKELQSSEIQKDQFFVKQLKREIIRLKQEETALMKEEAKLKKKEIKEQIKKWEEIQTEIKSKKTAVELEQQRKQNQQQMKLQKEQEELEKRKRNEKKKLIQKKLKQIEKNRSKRDQIMKFAEIEHKKLHPKYLEIQKKYQQIQNEIKFEEDILKKNHSLSTKIDYNVIKNHEKEYMNKVEQRNRKRESLKASSVDEKKTDFTPFLLRDQTRIEEEKIKFKRRHDFEERLKQIPIHINSAVTLKIEIERDKGKHPLKYHFLGEKALTNQQIFKEFPHFQMNIHPKEVGNEYLKELPLINENSRVVRSQSESTLFRNISERTKYKDYLYDLKTSRPIQMEIDQDELLRSNQSVGNKRKVLELLAQKQKRYHFELRKRQEEFQRSNTVKTSMKKSKEIDEIYSKSIKAKLARLEINQ